MKRILRIPQVYEFYINLIGGKKFFKNYADNFLAIKENQSVLELGCGPGNIIHFLPQKINYIGLDLNNDCINYCKKLFPSFDFLIKDIASDFEFNQKFDVIFSEGVMACLSDEQIENMLKNIYKHSKKDSRIVLSDMNFCSKNSKIQNFFLKRERGKNLRSTQDFLNIYKKFSDWLEIVEVIEIRKAFKIPNSKVIVISKRK